MSDAPTPERPEDAHADDAPSLEQLERDAIPATVRHAPRLGRMLGTGIGIGVGVGLVLGFALPNSTGVGRGMVAVVMALGTGLLGALIAGVIATRIDHVSSKHADEQRARELDEWLDDRDYPPGEDPFATGERRG